jgi:hypothetical protein
MNIINILNLEKRKPVKITVIWIYLWIMSLAIEKPQNIIKAFTPRL